jgi:DNA-binding winged helix-turn-helix (wHTH) protein
VALRYRVDDLLIDAGARQVLRDGRLLPISGLTFDLLWTLVRAAPSLVPAEELLRAVWPLAVVAPETLTQRVKLLRRALGDSGEGARYIESERGRGYRCVVPAHPESDTAASAVPHTAGTQDVAAYRLYLQARKANRGTRDSVSRSLSLIDQALDRDPNFAHAMAYRAVLQAGGVMLRGLPAEMLEEPQRFARRALEACPDLADAHMALGLISAMLGAWIESAERFRAAMAIEPSIPTARNMHALAVLRPTGRLTEALSELRHSYGLSPAEGFTAHEFAITHSLMGHDEEALRYVELTQTLSGMATHWDLKLVRARAASRRGDYAEAERYAVEALPEVLRPTAGIEVIHSLYAALQNPAASGITGFVDSLMMPGVDARTRIFFVTGLVMLGDLDGAWTALQLMLERAGAFISQIDWSDLWTAEMIPLRRDRRFDGLVSRLQFAPYWQCFGPADWLRP